MSDLTRTVTWVPAGERLPDSIRRVLAWAPGLTTWPPVVTVRYEAMRARWSFDEPSSPAVPAAVTHWAELPEGP